MNVRLRPVVQRIADVTVPVCQPKRRRGITPAGSGVLLGVAESTYLLTASHVFENAAPDLAIALIAGQQFVSITSVPRWRTKSPANRR